MSKTNPFTGAEYDCHCDYSYTCQDCAAVREEYVRREQKKAREKWLIEAVQQIAERLGMKLEPPPDLED
jgi:hypothetical protein